MAEHFEAGSLGPEIAEGIDSVLASRPIPAELRRALLRGRDILSADREVCRTFSLLANAYGHPPETRTIVFGTPTQEQPDIVRAVHCSDDRITQIAVASDRVDQEPDAVAADAERLVPTIHRRFLKTTGR